MSLLVCSDVLYVCEMIHMCLLDNEMNCQNGATLYVYECESLILGSEIPGSRVWQTPYAPGLQNNWSALLQIKKAKIFISISFTCPIRYCPHPEDMEILYSYEHLSVTLALGLKMNTLKSFQINS